MSRRTRTSVASPMTLQAHLKEARNRLFVVIAVFVLFSSLAYTVYDRILWALLLPLHGQRLMYLTPAGGFSFIMVVTLWAGFAATLPFLLYNIYQFVAPTLPAKVRSRGALVLISSCVLFASGASFGYFFAIPGALHFLTGFGNQYVQAMITADAYLNFTLLYTVGLGILFQIPILMMITHWINPLKPGGLLKAERYVILIAFIVGALLSPSPDALNQTIIAAPFILMYQIGLVGVLISTARAKRQSQRAVPDVKRPPRVVDQVMPQPAVQQRPVVAVLPSRGAQHRSVDGMRRARPVGVQVPTRVTSVAAARPTASRRQAMDVFAIRPENA